MYTIIIICVIAGLVWGTVFALRGSLVVGCAIYLVAASCFANYFYTIDAAGLTWTIDRLVLFLLVVAFVVQWRVGLTDSKRFMSGEILLVLFLGLLIVSTFTHDWRTIGPDNVPVVMHLINGYIVPLALFWIARQAMLTERNVHGMYAVLGCFGIYLCITAILEIAKQWSFVFPSYIGDSELGIHFGRARGPMLQSARFGTYLVICLAAGWMSWGWLGRFGRVGRLIAVAVIPLYAIAVYFTYTRSVWMGLGLSAAIIVALTLQGKPRVMALGTMFAVALIALIIKGNSLVAFKREYTADDTRKSTYMRVSFAYVSWQMFQDKPLAGFGFGQFPRESKYYLGDRSTNLHLESIRGYVHHNTFLSLLVELGIFGPILFVAVFIHWIRIAWNLWRDHGAPNWARAHGAFFLAMLSPYGFQLLFRDVSFSPIENGIVFMMAGLATGLHLMNAPEQKRAWQNHGGRVMRQPHPV